MSLQACWAAKRALAPSLRPNPVTSGGLEQNRPGRRHSLCYSGYPPTPLKPILKLPKILYEQVAGGSVGSCESPRGFGPKSIA